MKNSRRAFLSQSAVITSGFLGLERLLGEETVKSADPYGPLINDPKEIIDLPKGFSYTVVSETGDRMNDGFKVPGAPDGMGVFAIDNDRVTVVRNHEIGHSHYQVGPFDNNKGLPDSVAPEMSFDPGRFGAQPFVGGTTNLIFNTRTQKVESQHLSLTGTDRNCAGGITPWGSWITCEEPGDMVSQWGKDHGYNFEVPADGKGLTRPVPLTDMGRFRHEAVAVDPATGYVYETEDRGDSAIYRFIPNEKANLAAGGKLQALRIVDKNWQDTRNRNTSKPAFPQGQRVKVEWFDLEGVESPKDDLRLRAAEKGAAIFSRGEGMWYGSTSDVGESTIYWACTDGGSRKYGQIFRYYPDTSEMDLYLEPNNSKMLRNADNVTVSPGSGHLYICEDTVAVSHLRGVTKDGELFTFARNAQVLKGKKGLSEFAGACFSPDGKTLFINIQSPGTTLAITGPFV